MSNRTSNSSSHAAASKAATAAQKPILERWRSYTGVSWEEPADGSDPVPFAGSVRSPICGIHFDPKGRAFVSTPRLLSADGPSTLSLLDIEVQTGPARLTAFPSVEGNAVSGSPDQNLRSVLGFWIDGTNGWLWALDMGYVAGEAEAPVGAQKVVVYELATGRTVKQIVLDGAADRRGSFLNDIVVDEVRKVGYISDSGLRGAPENRAGIIVADFVSDDAWRVLDAHPSVQAVPGVKVVSNGREVWPGNPMKLGINGIALSPDGNTLYWTVTTGLHVHAILAEVLRQSHGSDAVIAGAVRDLGDGGGNTDGIVTGANGEVYITDVTRGGIVKYDPSTNAMALVASHPCVHRPDTPTMDPAGDLVFTSSNLDRHFEGAVKSGEERYELWRLKLNSR